ncbi:ribonuclease M5 [Alicyclobacillus fastidiosus]|uniref:Ribonuclease M5 n=1 Tax=Alicyclobacillus fastidiosus TaxID=392011 RepID=A0ABY6ZJA8_9BACL|nr:ribonuclease M5 [Alicyclobacillus fastidiosus]WAH42191.1 ribonuclease M5 [Alicyclobacillus fastidiosus]GMA63982.1 ribonuclease M5 [Alicyclobacillus fastidiosus]
MVNEHERPVVDEIVVVEGIHDKQVVDLAVQADVHVLGGDRIGQRTMDVLRRAVRTRGVIVLTDPDGAGERIRRRIDQAVPGCGHAHIPRKRAQSAKGLGVEHAAPADVRAAILKVRLSRSESHPSTTPVERFTQSDLLEARLLGCEEAAARRTALGDMLGIGYGNAKAFLNKLNTLGVTREEWESALERLQTE